MQDLRSPERAFTLVELLTVIGIIAVMAGLAVPAVTSLSRANQLNNTSRLVSNLLTIARTEAITQRAVTRFAVASQWPDRPEANYRRMSVLKKPDPAKDEWVQISKWEEVPPGVAFDQDDTDGNFLAMDDAKGPLDVGGKAVEYKYAEFYPTGGLNRREAIGMEIWMRLAMQQQQSQSTNWAKISASALTGRVKIARP